MKIFIVIPAYNEQASIVAVIRDIKKNGFGKIIVVDDGSVDQTAELAAAEKGVEVVRHLVNCGPGAAIQTGLTVAVARGAQIIVTIDADQQHDPRDIQRLIDNLSPGKIDLVIGSRFLQKNEIPWVRRVFNFGGNLITWLIAGVWVTDSQSGFKVLSSSAATKMDLAMNGYEFCTELIQQVVKQGIRWKEVPIKVKYSKQSLAKGQSFASGVKMVIRLFIKSLTH
jgi:glycosyltransferase involved in cell wall biosynthesis